jgi:hypothetical protein
MGRVTCTRRSFSWKSDRCLDPIGFRESITARDERIAQANPPLDAEVVFDDRRLVRKTALISEGITAANGMTWNKSLGTTAPSTARRRCASRTLIPAGSCQLEIPNSQPCRSDLARLLKLFFAVVPFSV